MVSEGLDEEGIRRTNGRLPVGFRDTINKTCEDVFDCC